MTTSRSPGTGAIRTSPLPGRSWCEIADRPKDKAQGLKFANWLQQIGCFLTFPQPSPLFYNNSVKGFTEVDKHEMNFPDKFLKWGKVHGSEGLVGNETGP